jgi:hypothetical protein
MQQLRQANAGGGYLDPGWLVTGVASDEPTSTFTVRKGRLSLFVRTDQMMPIGTEPAGIGAQVAVRFPKDRQATTPGFYRALGSAGPPNGGEALVRWYFHLLPAAAPRLMERLTTELNRLAVPFALKMLNHPAAYSRPDAAVLYLPRATFAATKKVVLAAHRALDDLVVARVPALTRAVRPGLGLAEEPNQTGRLVSFGQHRSRLIAQGLVDAAARGSTSPGGRLEGVLAAFAAARISLDAPHLNPGSSEFDIESA